MTAIDWMIIILCILGAYYGGRIGFIFSVAFLAAGFLGSWFASNYYTLCADFFEPHPQAMIYGYLCVFLMVLLMMIGAGFIIHKFFKTFCLGAVNRIFGALIGLFLGVIITAGIYMPLSTLNNKKIHATLGRSLLLPHIMRYTARAITLFPPDKKKIFQLNIPQEIKKIETNIKKLPAAIEKKLKK